MTDEELLELVKSGIGETSKYHDKTICIYINEIKECLKDAGVKQSVIDSNRSVGAVIRGVSDIWNMGSGDGILSPYFHYRVIQLAKNIGEQDE